MNKKLDVLSVIQPKVLKHGKTQRTDCLHSSENHPLPQLFFINHRTLEGRSVAPAMPTLQRQYGKLGRINGNCIL